MGSTFEDAYRAALAAGQPRLLITAHGSHESGETCYFIHRSPTSSENNVRRGGPNGGPKQEPHLKGFLEL